MRFFSLSCSLLLVFLLAGCSEVTSIEVQPGPEAGANRYSKTTGNGAPSGPHYNLNIIGVKKGKTAPMDGDNGHRIFVDLWGNTKILLYEGDTFEVLDANGTDNNGGAFQLPNPDPDGDGVTSYSVYARALGGPNGKATLTTCAEDPATGEEVCSTDNEVFVRTVGKGNSSKFTNVSKELLTLSIVIDSEETPDLAECLGVEGVEEVQVGLFDDCLENYFWDYENEGLKLLQLRFYEVPTDVTS